MIEWVHAARRLSPRMVVELLRWTDEQLAHAVDALDGAAVTASVTWASDGPVPVWLDQGRELSERWIHRQQLLQALGRESDLRADLAVPVLDGLRWAYPFRLAALRRPVGTVVAVTVGGAGVQLHWVLVCTGDEWEFDVPARGPASAELTLTTEQAWRLLTNNLDELELRRLPASGDAEIVRTLLRTRAIIGEPDAPAAPGYAVMPPSTMNSDPVQ